MTRSTPLTQAVTGTKKARATASALPTPASMTFLVFEDNGGRYRWTIVAAGGKSLVQSASFASYEEARHAARLVHTGAASASLEHLAGAAAATALADPVPRRQRVVVRDDLDAERWLDEGGSFDNEAVTRG